MTSNPHRLFHAILCVCLIAAFARVGRAAEAGQEQKFLRFVEDDEGGGRLETAIATYRNAAGVKVHLVAAVHVGEKAYYQGLSKTFAGYDALLYEMIKPKGAAVPQPGVRSDSTLSMFQRMLTDVLELEFQLDAIDYSAKNFVHADLDAETFTRMQEERGESMITLMLRVILDEMSKPQAQQQAQEVSLPELLVALTSPDRARHFKLILGRQFEDIESKVAGLQGPNGSVLLTERNKAAIATLKRTIAAGRKNIGIFYGAAHMSDMAQRLKELGFTYEGTEWRAAWDMTPRPGDVIIKTYKGKPATQPAN
jgi:hypothetical protein